MLNLRQGAGREAHSNTSPATSRNTFTANVRNKDWPVARALPPGSWG